MDWLLDDGLLEMNGFGWVDGWMEVMRCNDVVGMSMNIARAWDAIHSIA